MYNQQIVTPVPDPTPDPEPEFVDEPPTYDPIIEPNQPDDNDSELIMLLIIVTVASFVVFVEIVVISSVCGCMRCKLRRALSGQPVKQKAVRAKR